MTSRARLISSAAAFALACLVMITVHELGHAVAALAQGDSPVVYGFSVDDRSTSDQQQIVTALAGPVVSLLSGLILLALPIGRLTTFWQLGVMWAGLLSVQEFSGYLVTGPFAHVGDIASVLEITRAPAVVGWLGFVVGWALTYLTGRVAVRRLCRFTSADEPLAPQLRALGLFAWLLGAVVVIVVSAGLLTAGGVAADVVVFEALGVVSSGIFLVFVRLFLARVQVPETGRASTFSTPWLGIAVLVAVAVARQVVFSGGLHL